MSGKRTVSGGEKPAARDYARADLDDVSDNGEISPEEMASARPFAEAFPGLADSIRRGRGRQKAPTKQLISIRLDKAVVDAFKSTGEGWQSRINEALRKVAPK
ncbi:MAG TPA: BrnA antitoxin family protein [Rhodoblastus sp.]|nr:BrnA antitoxin family protein [Rhodoblastus sp.]